LSERLPNGEDEAMFAIADHFNAGAEWINDENERIKSDNNRGGDC
jgi:hypothetical protein